MMEYSEDIKHLVKERLLAMPPDVTFAVGGAGNYSPKELIREVDLGTEMGRETIEMELDFIRSMPKFLEKYDKS